MYFPKDFYFGPSADEIKKIKNKKYCKLRKQRNQKINADLFRDTIQISTTASKKKFIFDAKENNDTNNSQIICDTSNYENEIEIDNENDTAREINFQDNIENKNNEILIENVQFNQFWLS